MRNILNRRIKLLILSIGAVIVTASCQYKELNDTTWPEQLIYMPAALYNNFTINTVPSAIAATPTEGYATRFVVDSVARKFNVLLGAYRSGKDNAGSFMVNITVNTDTINKMLAIAGRLPVGTILLPSDKYTIPSTVEVKNGSDIGKFELAVDLDYLIANYPIAPATKTFAIAVGISSTARKSNPKLATTIIVIDAKIMKPVPTFTAAAGTNPKTINFANTSLYGTKFIWSFGDGTPDKTTTNMKNEAVSHTYAAAGTYNVTLTVIGISGMANKATLTKSQVVL